jgi:hypothetical protein
VRHLNVRLPREALSRLLRAECESASLIVELVVNGTDPTQVATERGVSRPALVEQLRHAVGALAIRYEKWKCAQEGLREMELSALRSSHLMRKRPVCFRAGVASTWSQRPLE